MPTLAQTISAAKTTGLYTGIGTIGFVGGSLTGAAIAGQTENDPNVGGLVGGTIGAAAGALTTHIARHPLKTLEAIGTPVYNLNKGIYKGLHKNITDGTAKGLAEKIGTKLVDASGAIGKAGGLTLATGAGVATKVGANMLGVANHLIKADEASMVGYKLNGWGGAAIAGFSLVKGIAGGFSTFNKMRQGTVDANVTRATPQPIYSSMMNNAGATGDLVFALHNNRRG